MNDTTWMHEVLQDMAAYAIEYGLPKTYDAITKAMVATTNETEQMRLPQITTGNVVALFQRSNVNVSNP